MLGICNQQKSRGLIYIYIYINGRWLTGDCLFNCWCMTGIPPYVNQRNDLLVDTAPRIYPENVTRLIRIGALEELGIITATNWSSVNKHKLFICSRSKLLILGDGHPALNSKSENPYNWVKRWTKISRVSKIPAIQLASADGPEPVATPLFFI